MQEERYKSIKVRQHVGLAEFTTLRVGGPADFFVVVETKEHIRDAVGYAKQNNLPMTILGGGSNVLIDESGIRGLVIINCLKGVSYKSCGDGVEVIAAAGENWDEFVAETVRKNLYGIENLSSIPGTVGATPIQNVGAYGVEVSNVIKEVLVFDTDSLEERVLSNEACKFAYRDSLFKTSAGKKYIILSVTYLLKKEGTLTTSYKDIQSVLDARDLAAPTLEEQREIIVGIRAGKFPDLKVYGTAGSFFKNPVVDKDSFKKIQSDMPDIVGHETKDGNIKVSAGWLLEHFGYKGLCEGPVCMYEKHALVLTTKRATATGIKNFSKKIIQDIKQKTNITLVPEVTFL